MAVLDFIYHGEANIFQDDFDEFWTLAEELELKGPTNTNERSEEMDQYDKKSLKIIPGTRAISQSKPPQQIQTNKEVQETIVENQETMAISNVNTSKVKIENTEIQIG